VFIIKRRKEITLALLLALKYFILMFLLGKNCFQNSLIQQPKETLLEFSKFYINPKEDILKIIKFFCILIYAWKKCKIQSLRVA